MKQRVDSLKEYPWQFSLLGRCLDLWIPRDLVCRLPDAVLENRLTSYRTPLCGCVGLMLAMTAVIRCDQRSAFLLFDTWENVSRDSGVVGKRSVCLIALQEKVSAKADVMSRGLP